MSHNPANRDTEGGKNSLCLRGFYPSTAVLRRRFICNKADAELKNEKSSPIRGIFFLPPNLSLDYEREFNYLNKTNSSSSK